MVQHPKPHMQLHCTYDNPSCRQLLFSILLKVSTEALSCLLHHNIVHAVETSTDKTSQASRACMTVSHHVDKPVRVL